MNIVETVLIIACIVVISVFVLAVLITGVRDNTHTSKEKEETILKQKAEIERLLREKDTLTREKVRLEGELDAYKGANPIIREKLHLLNQEKMKFSSEFIDALGGRYSPEFIRNGIERGRFDNIFKVDNKRLRLKSVDINAVVESDGEPRCVSLNSCNCKDFYAKKEGFACKHILYLAYILGILQQDSDITYKTEN